MKRKIKSTVARILGQTENILKINFDNCQGSETYVIRGSQLQLLRNEILNALNDLDRAGGDQDDESIKLYPGMIDMLSGAKLMDEFIIMTTPSWIDMFRLYNLLNVGLVYFNKHWIFIIEQQDFAKFISFIELANLSNRNSHYMVWKDKLINKDRN